MKLTNFCQIALKLYVDLIFLTADLRITNADAYQGDGYAIKFMIVFKPKRYDLFFDCLTYQKPIFFKKANSQLIFHERLLAFFEKISFIRSSSAN